MKNYRTLLLEFKNIMPSEDAVSALFSGTNGRDAILTRKPTNFVDLGPAIAMRSMPKAARDFITQLPTIGWKDVYGQAPVEGDEFWEPDGGRFKMKTPQWFLIRSGAMLILIDTEGYDYPRYAARIKK